MFAEATSASENIRLVLSFKPLVSREGLAWGGFAKAALERRLNRWALRATSPVELQSRRATLPGELQLKLAGHAAANEKAHHTME